MTGEPARRRRSLRLTGYDYTCAGAYFVTICAQDQACLFGNVVDGCMCLDDAGHMLGMLWNDIPARFADVEIDTFVVMPNHVHGIVVLPDAANGVTRRAAPALGEVVAAFKSATTVQYIHGVKTRAWPAFRRRLWQRNYYEHLVRDEKALDRIRRYIDENPARWALDDENPEKVPA
ncbi:MAG TPA: transposase [Xanthobacteraceae bacterium]|nr:transposase [Xanthobacteraceae bacterium]